MAVTQYSISSHGWVQGIPDTPLEGDYLRRHSQPSSYSCLNICTGSFLCLRTFLLLRVSLLPHASLLSPPSLPQHFGYLGPSCHESITPTHHGIVNNDQQINFGFAATNPSCLCRDQFCPTCAFSTSRYACQFPHPSAWLGLLPHPHGWLRDSQPPQGGRANVGGVIFYLFLDKFLFLLIVCPIAMLGPNATSANSNRPSTVVVLPWPLLHATSLTIVHVGHVTGSAPAKIRAKQ